MFDIVSVRSTLRFTLEVFKNLFKEHLNQDYSQEDYVTQFTIRVPELLAKIERIEKVYRETVPDAPDELYSLLDEQKIRLEETQKKLGAYISPEKFV